MQFSNSQKLAAVLSEWARPAIAELATSRLTQLPMLRSLQMVFVNSGLVCPGYNIGNEIKPFASNIVESMLMPTLTSYMSRIPDDALPAMAHSIVDTAISQPRFSILDGLIEFSREDLYELKELLDKNLPQEPANEKYEIIK